VLTKNVFKILFDQITKTSHGHVNGIELIPVVNMAVKQDSSVTEFTKSQSLAASTVTTSPGDSSISTDSVKSRTSKQPLEKRTGGQAACVLL
jgi:hypothetical protein